MLVRFRFRPASRPGSRICPIGSPEGEKISISGFGTFEVRERAERQGINPRTREPITIAASRSIVFKPGKSLKDTL